MEQQQQQLQQQQLQQQQHLPHYVAGQPVLSAC